MWTSERNRFLSAQEPGAELGVVTLGGETTGVLVGGERRWLPVCCPGGITWLPKAGDKVLVLKAGAEQESPCVVGVLQQGTALNPGEVRLSSDGGGTLFLRGDKVELTGTVTINGKDLDDYIRDIAGKGGV